MTDAQPAPLQPPAAAEASLTLTAPPPPQPVATTSAPEMAPAVEAAALPGLDAKVDSYLGLADERRAQFPRSSRRRPPTCGPWATATSARRPRRSNRLLKSPVKALQEGGLSEGSKVGGTLLELRRTVEDLDPKEATGAKKLLGMIPFGDRVTDYFRKYQSAENHLDGILHALREGQDELGKDNAALNLEKQLLWDAMARLNQYVYVAERLDARLAAGIADLEATDPERARALRDDVLFYVRQKHQDLLTQLAVSIQNYLAIDIVIKNNIELMKGVDRASTTTISALRTAVIVAQALGNQKLVLDQITALNTTTSGMIERTSEMLRDNSVAHPGAGGVGHGRAAPAAGGVREHLRHHGRNRQLQGAGARQHGRHDRDARDRGDQVPGIPRAGRAAGPGRRTRVPGPRRFEVRRALHLPDEGIVEPCRVVSSVASSAAMSTTSAASASPRRPSPPAPTCSRPWPASRR